MSNEEPLLCRCYTDKRVLPVCKKRALLEVLRGILPHLEEIPFFQSMVGRLALPMVKKEAAKFVAQLEQELAEG